MRSAALALLVAAAGCAVQPDYRPPDADLPQAWRESAPRPAGEAPWWTVYGDAELERLMQEALAQNSDLLVAAARVDEARALLGEAQSGLRPQVQAGASAGRSLSSAATGLLPPGTPRERDNYRATLDLSWEIDLFGRLRAAREAARAELAASEALRDGVRLALTARVAASYYGLLALDAQVELTRRALALREESLALQRRRRAAGVISDYDLRQIEAEAATLRAQLPPLERDREIEEAALAALLGRSPRAVFESALARSALAQAPAATAVPAGMPSELLLRRPDLVEAERRLAAANARVAAARAAYFPRISLTGLLGSESAELGDLFTGPAGIWSFAAALAQPIYGGGRLAAQRDAAAARERAALAQYQGAVRNAFREVRQALAAQGRARESFEAQAERVRALEETLRLARLRYASGIASQLDVLDAERGLLAAQTARVDALRAQRAAVADLYRALGG
ncbi:MAG TPA: efflux transporter outer membrane subunit [Burkholderiales bacterium]|nr:efflux transporter outer membrane subunit [Burkholderiales bacterium]